MDLQRIERVAEELLWESLPLAHCLDYKVISWSMLYLIDPGDVVTVKRVRESDLRTGDIIVYRSPDPRCSCPIIHRIIHRERSGNECRYLTRGDYNTKPDQIRIRYGEIFGKVVAVKKTKWGIKLNIEHWFGRLVSRGVGAVTRACARQKALSTRCHRRADEGK